MASRTQGPQEYRSYLRSKCIVGYGVINGIINALIFLAINWGNADGIFTRDGIIGEMALTGVLLGLILTWCVVPLTKMDLRKRVYAASPAGYGVAARLPRRAVPMSLAVGVIALVVAVAASVLLTLVLPLPLDRTGMMLLKGFLCAVTGAVSGYLVIGRVTSDALEEAPAARA